VPHESAPFASALAVQRAVLWAGAAVPLAFNLTWWGAYVSSGSPYVISGPAYVSSGPPDILEVLISGIAGAIWTLFPYWLALRRRRAATRFEAYVSLAAAVLVAAPGALVYLAGYYSDRPSTLGRAMLAAVVPVYQCIILAAEFALCWAMRQVLRAPGTGRE
jgi:hypothetical protein